MDSNSLIQQYLLGSLSAEEVQQLDQRLADDPDLRREYLLAAEVDSGMREIAVERSIEETQHSKTRPSRGWKLLAGGSLLAAGLAIAASLLLVLGPMQSRPSPVATLASSENAAWESDLPTSPGAKLPPGSLNLKAGVATIRFHSGAELVVEAPAGITLLSTMSARLTSGAAVMQVPDSATGFVLETPHGYAIDFGTRFAVNVDPQDGRTDFELIEGEIEVHHPRTGDSLRLDHAGYSAEISGKSLAIKSDSETETPPSEPRVLRLGTDGRCGSAMVRNDRRDKLIKPEYLYVKHSKSQRWDFRSFFSFDLSNVDLSEVSTARLRLNLVPSDKGFASRLPTINRFAVYGLTNQAKADWKADAGWDDSPGPDDGVLLGTFEIPRSQERGVFGIANEQLLSFLREHTGEPVTLILVRQTSQVSGHGPGLTHLFASDQNPESVGPLLELTTK